MNSKTSRIWGVRQDWIVGLLVFGVAFNALIIIGNTFYTELVLKSRFRSGSISIGLSLLVGLTLLYLSRLLARRKKVAWIMVIPIYVFILGLNLSLLIIREDSGRISLRSFLVNVVLPVIVLICLALSEKQFTVKSDLRSFASSLRFIILILAITLCYGVVGFQLLDERDFHQDFSVFDSFHRTIDQFDLTTSHPLVPYTRRARIFIDSLSIISTGAVFYALISLFQPLKARFVDQSHNRAIMKSLLERYPANSEDFFKLWPHDKVYFINYEVTAGLAFHVQRGVALVVGDPVGDVSVFPSLLGQFDELCYVNDWDPAFVHTESKYNQLYENFGFTPQKIGEEAILSLDHFNNSVLGSKYFRHIKNKFSKAGFTTEILKPPHSNQVLNRLRVISNDWLAIPGRDERGLIMGYFSYPYLQQCTVLVAKDPQGQIQGFINQVHSYQPEEANYDLLRHTQSSPGNVNDFMLMAFIDYLRDKGFKSLNMGLCPLSGIDKDESQTLADNVMRFTYINGDRIYSFSGLRKFKEKYEPNWSDRFLVHRGGFPGLTKAYRSLNSAWKVRFRA